MMRISIQLERYSGVDDDNVDVKDRRMLEYLLYANEYWNSWSKQEIPIMLTVYNITL